MRWSVTGKSDEFKRQSRTVAQRWEEAGAETRYEELPGNHFTVLAPLADPRTRWSRASRNWPDESEDSGVSARLWDATLTVTILLTCVTV